MNQDSIPAFNLLDERWIPVRYIDGRVEDVGLLTLFQHSTDIAELAETSPPNLIALYRVLLAITHRALTCSLGTWKDKDRARWYREGLPVELICNYLETQRKRFWLFHATNPFMQVACLKTAKDTSADSSRLPWTKLTLDRANGNAPSLFDHSIDLAPSPLPAADAVRSLIGYLQFVPGGMVRRFRFRDESGPLDGTAAVVPVGTCVSQTISLILSTGNAEDIPSWECPPITESQLLLAKKTLPRGDVDVFTRITRAVLLEVDAEISTADHPMIRLVRFGAGLTLDVHSPSSPDPMIAYRVVNDGQALRPISFAEGRACWRDLPALISATQQSFCGPSVINRALNCLEYVGDQEPMRFLVGGTASDPVRYKIFRWRLDRFEVPTSIARTGDQQAVLLLCLRSSDESFSMFRKIATHLIYETLPKIIDEDRWKSARSRFAFGAIPTVYFSSLEHRLPSLLANIANCGSDHAYGDWCQAQIYALQAAWSTAIESVGNSPQALRAASLTHSRFQLLLHPLREASGRVESSSEEVSA